VIHVRHAVMARRRHEHDAEADAPRLDDANSDPTHDMRVLGKRVRKQFVGA